MREIDEDERREAMEDRRNGRRASMCLCGYPDWPGNCPGPANCPVHDEKSVNGE